MKVNLPLAAALALLLSAPLAAQWLNYKTPGIPRNPDGKANLSAPVPRTAEGKPDLTGIWRGMAGTPYNGNIAADLKPDEILPWAQKLTQEHMFNLGADSPRAHCLPDPPPYYHLNGIAQIVQTPAMMIIINEGGSNSNTTRMIHTDGRELLEDPNPTWLGYSVGKWEGDTLVVTTNGFNDRTWLDFGGHPHTEALRTIERFHRRDFGHMDFEMTLEDPKTFTRPITFKANKTLVPDGDILETICEYEQQTHHMTGTGAFRMTSEALAKYAGVYEFGPGRDVTLSVDGQLMLLKVSETRRSYTMAPQSEKLFMSTGFGEQAEFDIDASGAVTGFTFTTGSGLGLGNRPIFKGKAVRKGSPPSAAR